MTSYIERITRRKKSVVSNFITRERAFSGGYSYLQRPIIAHFRLAAETVGEAMHEAIHEYEKAKKNEATKNHIGG